MEIAKTDIKLMESKRLTDNDNGGGVITGNEVADGVVNNLFPDISRLDRTLGRVSLRKAFVAVDTDTQDTYFGSHVIISEPQADAGIDLLLMDTKSDFDQREEAQEEIQSPIDLSNSSPTSWYATGDSGGMSAVFRPEIIIAQSQLNDFFYTIPKTFPEFFAGGRIKIGALFYTIDFISDGDSDSMYVTLTAPLAADALEDETVYDSEDKTRWAIEANASQGTLTVSLKHVTYNPGVGDTVILQGSVVLIESVDSTNWRRPVYTFTRNVGSTVKGQPIKWIPSNTNQNKYYGVTTLSADVLATDTEITVTETDKFIFPLGAEEVDPLLIGLDASAVPASKRVNIIESAGVIVIHSTADEELPNPVTLGNTYALTGTDYQLIELIDANEVQVNPALYTVDLVAGSVSIEAGVDLSSYTQPFTAQKRYEDMRLVTAVDHATKVVTLGRALSQPFTAASTFVSSALILGDIQSSYANFFDQETWTDVWDDAVIGSSASATYNDTAFPVQVTNAGAITENWALVFTGATTFDIIGENTGQIGTGQTDAAPGTFTQPLNPDTGLPYFKLPQEGWGAGWSIGNALRFKTLGCNRPLWFIRVTQQSDDTIAPTDKFTVQIRGDAN